ncbi:MAG: hypothetical protein H6736_08075 [Alphaproteobacteria bacterium]|nr:hypothetical protein [Alphaproteobacteria bacterium]MCB9691756.1 hypothetical protein [Alphaproteobacteria bacterium]
MRLLPLVLLGLSTSALASVDLIDDSGLEWTVNSTVISSMSFVMTPISTTPGGLVISSTMSFPFPVGTMVWIENATYTTAVPSTTASGGSTSIALADAFAGYGGMFVNGDPVDGDIGDVTLSCGGRELELPFANTSAGLKVTRRIYIPEDDSFARFLTVLTNDNANARSGTVRFEGFLESRSSTQILASSSGDAVASAADTWFATGGSATRPRIAHVFGDVDSFSRSAGDVSWTWNVSVPGNSTIVLMQLVAGTPTNPSAITRAAELAALPDAVTTCMDDTVKAQVLNFDLSTPSSCPGLDTDACTVLDEGTTIVEGMLPGVIDSGPARLSSSALYDGIEDAVLTAKGAGCSVTGTLAGRVQGGRFQIESDSGATGTGKFGASTVTGTFDGTAFSGARHRFTFYTDLGDAQTGVPGQATRVAGASSIFMAPMVTCPTDAGDAMTPWWPGPGPI